MSSLMEGGAQQHVSRIIATLHAVLDFSADRVAEELEQVPQAEMDAVLAAVARHVVQYQSMRDSMSEMDRPGASWDSIVEREQDAVDLPYVRMTQSEFEAEKQRAKRDRRFRDWHGWRAWVERVDGKRRSAARASLPPRQRSLLEMLQSDRLEMLNYGHALFVTAEARDKALLDIEAEIRRIGGRVERTDEQREAITNIEARLRQARAVKSCRCFIAAEMIRKFVVRNNTKSECEYCFDAFKRKRGDEVYCSRTCEKFAIRGKYD
uniref:Uncharacterized protein n=1 Tax=viral metagenome TaxID=1070528 RepID=A0A6C0HL52_9ZZZZ